MISAEDAVRACLAIQGWKSEEELLWMARQASKAKFVIDVGCWRGRTTKMMAPLVRGNGVVIAVDHLSASYTGESARNEILRKDGHVRILTDFLFNLEMELQAGRVYGVFMDGDEARSSVRTFLADAKADFCWIDGDHGYRDVVADIKAYREMMAPGSIFSGHDYEPSFPDVIRAVNELVPGVERGPGSIWFSRIE